MAYLGGLNRVMGAVFGGAQVLVYIWMAFIILHYVVGTSAGNVLMQQIQDNVVLSFIDSHNLLQPLADRMIAKIF